MEALRHLDPADAGRATEALELGDRHECLDEAPSGPRHHRAARGQRREHERGEARLASHDDFDARAARVQARGTCLLHAGRRSSRPGRERDLGDGRLEPGEHVARRRNRSRRCVRPRSARGEEGDRKGHQRPTRGPSSSPAHASPGFQPLERLLGSVPGAPGSVNTKRRGSPVRGRAEARKRPMSRQTQMDDPARSQPPPEPRIRLVAPVEGEGPATTRSSAPTGASRTSSTTCSRSRASTRCSSASPTRWTRSSRTRRCTSTRPTSPSASSCRRSYEANGPRRS